MALNGPVLVIEDDPNDTEVIEAAIKDIGVRNEVRTFNSANDALDYLQNTEEQPLLILCDVRMPGMDGLAFLQTIYQDEYLRKKSIPFIFFTVIVTPDIVNRAYDLGVQGFYKKPTNYTALKDQLLAILVYWRNCLHPNSDQERLQQAR